jgi:hypothetical protein
MALLAGARLFENSEDFGFDILASGGLVATTTVSARDPANKRVADDREANDC